MLDPVFAAVVSWDLQQIQVAEQFRLAATLDLLPQVSIPQAQTILNYTFQLAGLEAFFFGEVLPQVLLFNQLQGV